MRHYYDLCPTCNAELEPMFGVVFDTWPGSYPAKCTKCEYMGRSYRLKDCLECGWPLPKDLQPKEEKETEE